jgi:pimeloyl-ACP methyl ester carboxylesterase
MASKAALNLFIKKLDRDGEKLKIDFKGDSYLVDYAFVTHSRAIKKRPVLILQGFYSSLITLSELAYYLWLKGRRNVILVSLPGSGWSSDPQESWLKNRQDFKNEALFLLKVLDKLKVKKVDVIGHSMGAVIGGTLAKIQPKRVSKLILINPAGFLKGRPLLSVSKMIWMDIKDFFQRKIKKLDFPYFYIKKAYSQGSFLKGIRKKLRRLEYKRVLGQPYLLNFLEKGLVKKDVFAFFSEKDRLFPANKLINIFDRKHLPYLVIPGAYHFVYGHEVLDNLLRILSGKKFLG